MKKSYLILPLLCLGIAACSKSKEEPVKGAATCDKNGIPIKVQFNKVAVQLPDSVMLFWLSLPADNDDFTEDLYIFCNATPARQYILNNVYMSAQPNPASGSFAVSNYDLSVANYKLVTSDTMNSFIHITHQEGNFTKNLQAEFSITFYKVNAPSNYPDTLRIRNGKIDLSGVDAEIWK
jgi:hypothetical protein